ncbi:MAG: hypothetical protein SOX72_00350 [Oscillospiraceae bacterium]|nr:hypothetical protein [Oscillospiraceae bacterium]
MEEVFRTAQGVSVPSVRGLCSGYREEGREGETVFTVSLTAPRQEELLRRFCRGLREPAYFTLELPVIEGEALPRGQERLLYDVYYLDGCTRPVLDALLDRYAELLCSDGLVRFGFASHEERDEIYVSDYKVIQVYTAAPGRTREILKGMGVPFKEDLRTLWDAVDEQHPAELSLVEAEEEWIFDIPENLKDAGMYLSGRREE